MRTIAMLRCSTADQSLKHQREAAERWALAEGVTLEIHEEHGVSGCASKRPVLEAVVAECRAGKVSALWVWELSRLGRSLVAVVALLDELHRLGVRVIVSRQGIDYGTPAGRFMAQMMSALAEFEREQLVERIRSGLEATRDPLTGKMTRTRSGMPSGKPAFIWDDETGAAVLEVFRGLREAGVPFLKLLPAAQDAGHDIRVFRWAKGADGKAEQRPAVPSLGAVRRALASLG